MPKLTTGNCGQGFKEVYHVESYQEEYKAFDSLPSGIRQLVNNCPQKLSGHEIKSLMDAGMPPLEVLRLLVLRKEGISTLDGVRYDL